MPPNYDVLEDTASYHGTKIKTPPPSQLYKDNYDKIFGKKEKPVQAEEEKRLDAF